MDILTQIEPISKVLNAIGTIGILVFFVIAFYSGRIISGVVLDKILLSVTNTIKECMVDVRNDIRDAKSEIIEEINGRKQRRL